MILRALALPYHEYRGITPNPPHRRKEIYMVINIPEGPSDMLSKEAMVLERI